jgi:hypothetical protein
MKRAQDHLVRQHPNNAKYCGVCQGNCPLTTARRQGQNNAGGQDKKQCSSVQSHPPHLDILFFKTKSLLIRFSHYFLFEEHIND